jgi:hypothetical protein
MSNTAARHLRVVDTNGEIVELDHEDPAETIRALEAALTRAQRTINGLELRLADQRAKLRKAHPIDPAFHDWRDKLVATGRKGMVRARLSPDRIASMGALFEAGYTLEDFELANTGIAACQYVRYGKRCESGPEKDHRVCIGWVCKEAVRFEEAARLGALATKARA